MIDDPLRPNYSQLQLWLLKHSPIVSRLGIPTELIKAVERAVASGKETDCTTVLLRIKEYERDKSKLKTLETGGDADGPSPLAELPEWNSDLCKLNFGGKVVRTLRPIAEAACRILAAFQEDGWPSRIDSPLRVEHDLSRAVRTLNDGLKMLHFRRDGSGEGILWEALK